MLAVSGLAAGAASAAGNSGSAPSAAAVSLTYRCRFPAAQHPVTVAVAVHVPAVAKVGKPIQPTGVTSTITLPPPAVSALRRPARGDRERGHRAHRRESEGSVGTMAVLRQGPLRARSISRRAVT